MNLYAYLANSPGSGRDAEGHEEDVAKNGNATSRVENGMANDEGTSAAGESVLDSTVSATPQAQQQQPADQPLTNVVYNETGSLRADPNAKPGAPGSA